MIPKLGDPVHIALPDGTRILEGYVHKITHEQEEVFAQPQQTMVLPVDKLDVEIRFQLSAESSPYVDYLAVTLPGEAFPD